MATNSPFLHQPFHLPHLALEEAVDADLAAVGVEGDGGEAGEGGVTPNLFPKKGTPCSDTKMPVRAHIGCRLHFFAKKCTFMVGKCHFHNIDFQ